MDYAVTAKEILRKVGGEANTRYSSTRDGVYAGTVPSGTDAGTYTVWYKQLGDTNHSDSEPQAIQVTIRTKALTAGDITITLSGNDLKTDAGNYYYDYDGTEKTPAVTVEYGAAVIPAGEYAISYRDNKNVTTNAAVTIADKEGGNYELPGVSVTFEIRKCGAQLSQLYEKALDEVGEDNAALGYRAIRICCPADDQAYCPGRTSPRLLGGNLRRAGRGPEAHRGLSAYGRR